MTDVPSTSATAPASKRRKKCPVLPDLDPALFGTPQQSADDDEGAAADLARGCPHRRVAHVAGQFPSHVYVPLAPRAAADAVTEAGTALVTALATADLSTALAGRTFAPTPRTSLHVSLSRDFVLFRDALEPFCTALRDALASTRRLAFDIDVAQVHVLTNDDGTRVFVAFGVNTGAAQLQTLVRGTVDPLLTRFGAAAPYPAPARMHVSVASVVPRIPIDSAALDALQKRVDAVWSSDSASVSGVVHAEARTVHCKRGDRCFVVQLN